MPTAVDSETLAFGFCSTKSSTIIEHQNSPTLSRETVNVPILTFDKSNVLFLHNLTQPHFGMNTLQVSKLNLTL